MKVAVIRGGRSSEHEISMESGSSVAAGLREAGHEVTDVVIERDGRWTAGDRPVEMTPAAGLLGCDAAFPVLHGPGGEDGSVQGLLEVLGVPYVGSDVEASALCMDKIAFKRLLGAADVPQVDFADASLAPGSTPEDPADLHPGWRDRAAALGLPLWAKPSRLGSSVGISKVESLDGLDEAVALARRHDPKVIVEANSPGKEVECSVLGHSELTVSVPGEIVAHADWYDYEAKYSEGGMELRVPADIADPASKKLRRLAEQVFRLCGCSGLARCDFFVEGEAVLVNELNTIPGFTTTSVYGKLLAASGIAYPDLCERLVEIALERHADVGAYEF
jgi:D-alanine-D-alanine ligase